MCWLSYSISYLQVYHPSDIINTWILTKVCPNMILQSDENSKGFQNDKVEVAITHDDDWASVIQDVSCLLAKLAAENNLNPE